MSDSDDDSLQNNVFTFQNDNTTICGKGPNVNNTNITGLSFRNNVLTSTMHMPANFERQRYGGSNFDQRSIYNRREVSPMSLRSVPDYGLPTFNRSTYQNGRGFQRSMYNGRGGSPMSVRTIDSTASVSAADIVFAFKNVKFNKYDLRIIKDAYNKLIKTRQRKRIEKRRNLKLFLKGTRRKSGADSGEQGSDSSISSDDCRSVRSTICKENIPRLKQKRDLSHFGANMHRAPIHMTDMSHFSTNGKDNPIFTDCTENIKLNTMRNMMHINNSVSNLITKENIMKTQSYNPPIIKVQNTSVMTQKERFNKGFVLPAQRFNKTITGQTKGNNNHKNTKISGKNKIDPTKLSESESGSDQEEIFKEISVSQKQSQNVQRKRSLDNDDFCYSNNKRNKLDSPQKFKRTKNSESTCDNITDGMSNDFIFAKPKMPIKKNNPKKDVFPEKLLAKSRVPPIMEEFDFVQNDKGVLVENKNAKEIENHSPSNTHSNTDVSMRPSFIKRKLFTQKLDVAENKNVSSDSVGVNSPQNIYSGSIRERNKARKLVTSQSCLSREVAGEDNNVLDLIHKIVPPDQINVTNVANKTEPCSNKSNNIDNSNKWDVTAVIASCDNQDISDTYTDEEIFNVNQDKNSEKLKKPLQGKQDVPQCKIVMEKLKSHVLIKSIKNNSNNVVKNTKPVAKETSKKSVTDCVKSFWDTDFESDMELNVAPSWKTNTQQNQDLVFQRQNSDFADKQNRNSKKGPITKGTILTVRDCYKDTKLNNSLKSHKSPNDSNRKDRDINKLKSQAQGKDTNVGKINKETNLTSQTGKKTDTIKENAPVNNKNKSGRKPKTKQCVDCTYTDKPKNTSKKLNKSTEEAKHDDKSDKKNVKKSTNNGNLSEKVTLKAKNAKNAEYNKTNKDATDKVIKSNQKNKAIVQKGAVNGRTQPKRKSKEKSFIQSPKPRTITSNTKTSNKKPKSTSVKELVSNNTSMSSISTIITRSREKLSFNSTGGDYSSMNLSNISNRSLRLRQRVQRNIN